MFDAEAVNRKTVMIKETGLALMTSDFRLLVDPLYWDIQSPQVSFNFRHVISNIAGLFIDIK